MTVEGRFVNFYQHLGISQHEDRATARSKILQALKLNHPDKHLHASERDKTLTQGKACILNDAKHIFSEDNRLAAWRYVNSTDLNSWFRNNQGRPTQSTGFFDPETYLIWPTEDAFFFHQDAPITTPAVPLTRKRSRECDAVVNEMRTATEDPVKEESDEERPPKVRRQQAQRDMTPTAFADGNHGGSTGSDPHTDDGAGTVRDEDPASRPAHNEKKGTSSTRMKTFARQSALDMDESYKPKWNISNDGNTAYYGPGRHTRLSTWRNHTRPGLYGVTVEDQFQSIPGYLNCFLGRTAVEPGLASEATMPTLSERTRSPY